MGSRFLTRDYDPGKSLHYALAQRATRSSPKWTCDRDCLSPSLLHLHGFEVDLVSRVHVPAVIVRSL